MAIKIGEYTFDGPYTSIDRIENRPGIFVIFCSKEYYCFIDVGESAAVKSTITDHERKDCWENRCQCVPEIAVYYTPDLQQSRRISIEQTIRNQHDVLFGERQILTRPGY